MKLRYSTYVCMAAYNTVYTIAKALDGDIGVLKEKLNGG